MSSSRENPDQQDAMLGDQGQQGCVPSISKCLKMNREGTSSSDDVSTEAFQGQQRRIPPTYVMPSRLRRLFNRNRERVVSSSPINDEVQPRSNRRQRSRKLFDWATTAGCIGGNREESSSGQELSELRQSSSSAEGLLELSSHDSSKELSSTQHEGQELQGSEQRTLHASTTVLDKTSFESNRSSRELFRFGSFNSDRGVTSWGANQDVLSKSDRLLKKSIEDRKLKNKGKGSRSKSSDDIGSPDAQTSKEKLHSMTQLNSPGKSRRHAPAPIIRSMGSFSATRCKSDKELRKKSNVKRPIIYKSNAPRAKSSSESDIVDKEKTTEDEGNKKQICNPLDLVIHKKSKKLKFERNNTGNTFIIDPQNPEHQKIILLEEKLQWASNKGEQKLRTAEVPRSGSDDSMKRTESDTEMLRRVTKDFSWKQMWRNTIKAPRRKLHLRWLRYKASRVRHPSQPWHLEPIVQWRRSEDLPPEASKSASERCLREKPTIIKPDRAATFDSAGLPTNEYFSYYYPYISQTETFGYSKDSAFKDVVIEECSKEVTKFENDGQSPRSKSRTITNNDLQETTSRTQSLAMPSTSRDDSLRTQNVTVPSTSRCRIPGTLNLISSGTSKDGNNDTQNVSLPSTTRSNFNAPQNAAIPNTPRGGPFPGYSFSNTKKGDNLDPLKLFSGSPIIEVDEEIDSEDETLSTSV